MLPKQIKTRSTRFVTAPAYVSFGEITPDRFSKTSIGNTMPGSGGSRFLQAVDPELAVPRRVARTYWRD